MKNSILLSLLAFIGVPAFATPQTVKLDVPSMNCAMCPITVRKSLERVDGVSFAKVTFETRQAVVTFDDEQTTVDFLLEATSNAGYPSTVNIDDGAFDE